MGSFIKIWNNIMYMWCNGLLETLPMSFIDNISPKTQIKKIKLILKDTIADLLRFFKKTKIPESKIWFLVLTQNNVEALKNVKRNLDNSIYVSFFRFRSTVNVKAHYFYLNYRLIHDFIFPFKWLYYLLHDKKKAIRYYDLFFTVNGTYEECLRLLKKRKPKAIVFTNDHLVVARSLLLAANKLGVKTYYVQHASVTEYFPPLEFTHALLDGEDAYLKYKNCGEIKSIIHLVGMSKFDHYIDDYNEYDTLKYLGIAYNLTDDTDSVYHFIVKLRDRNPDLNIIVRAHPADKRNLPIIESVSISNPQKENAYEFIKRVDCLISGDSSIHLEAVLLNVYPCYYNFNVSKRFDYYGYVKNGLVEYFKDFESLNIKLKELKLNKPNIQYRAKFYNASIGTDFYGKSTEKILSIILDTITK